MEQILRNHTSEDWAFITLITIITLFITTKFVLKKNIESIFNYGKFIESRDNFWIFSIFINILLSSLIGLIFHKTIPESYLNRNFPPILSSIIIAFFIGLFFATRFSIDTTILYLTKNESTFNALIKSKSFFRTWVAVILTPICFITYYSNINHIYISYFVVFILLFLFIIEYIYPLKNKLRPKNFSLYYFILYLCTLEILPLLFIVKWLREFEMTL